MNRPGDWKEGEPLSGLTSLRLGGNAQYVSQPDTAAQLIADLEFARGIGLAISVLGRGSNVLCPDHGIAGLVVSLRRLNHRSIALTPGGCLSVGGGVPMPSIAAHAVRYGFTGLTFLGGIPGTLGGGVAMNAGIARPHKLEMGNRLVSIDVIDRDLNMRTIPATEIALGHRCSNIRELGFIVVGAALEITGRGSPTALRAELDQHLSSRVARQPTTDASAGSVFKNPPGNRPAGWYIDRVGLKGHRCGEAAFSQKHANWIINLGRATSSDVEALIHLARRRVEDAYGVRLQTEVVREEQLRWSAEGSR